MTIQFAITALTKDSGPLTKRIGLNADGSLHNDSSNCRMPSGTGDLQRYTLTEFARMLPVWRQNQAFSLGRLRPDLPDSVNIRTKRALNELNGTRAPNLIARTAEYIRYEPGKPALALIDSDLKNMPPDIAERVTAAGGIIPALISIIPEIANCGYVARLSTSSSIFRIDTNKQLTGNSGLHTYLLIQDGADNERFLRTLHDRCWLAGYGWIEVGKAGQFLFRSIVDWTVYAPERIVFEAAPELQEPLRQNTRVPYVQDGVPLDTWAACRDLTLVEKARLKALHAQERRRLAPEAAIAKGRYVDTHVPRIVAQTGCTPERARQIVECHIGGVLLPDIVLPLDDHPDGVHVGDILLNPETYVGLTLPDPVEGLSYGACKAMIMRRRNGSLWIRSHAHGLTVYDLKHDAASVEAAIMAAPEAMAADLLVRLMLQAEVDRIEADRLQALACKRSGAQSRSLGARIRAAAAEAEREAKAEAKAAREARRTDQRTRLPAPGINAPWLPMMQALNEVLGHVGGPEPPMRNIEGRLTEVLLNNIPSWHALTPAGSNAAEESDTRLPATKQPLLTALSDSEIAELIERHIEFIDPRTDDEVQLSGPFVKHFAERRDSMLPVVTGVATLPVVLADGNLVARQGLDRQSGTVFRIPEELLAILPKPEDCTEAAIKEAFRFLIDELLVDVTTSIAGKCVAISLMLTLIQRVLMPERPVFWVTAGQRGGGKTTLLTMIVMAITGIRPSAAAWSPNEEERRKALMAYLLRGVMYILWDNIARGVLIHCPHIEAACTSETKSDRNLGETRIVTALATAIQIFTGNNIGPKGDLASRSLRIEIEVDRVDPENRKYTHPAPIDWVEANRGKILASLYTILIGTKNMRAGGSNSAQTKGRFKDWWLLAGRPVEYAAALAGHELDFGKLFLELEDDEEESVTLTGALIALTSQWKHAREEKDAGTELLEFLFPDLLARTPNPVVTPKSVGKRLKKHCGAPVSVSIDDRQAALSLRVGSKQPSAPQKEGAAYWLKIS